MAAVLPRPQFDKCYTLRVVFCRSTVEVLHFVSMSNWTQHGTSRFVHLEKQYLYLQLNVSEIYSQGPTSVTKSKMDADVVDWNRNLFQYWLKLANQYFNIC